jgi:hypothetical protein
MGIILLDQIEQFQRRLLGFDIDGNAVIIIVIDQVDLIMGRGAEPQPPVNWGDLLEFRNSLKP